MYDKIEKTWIPIFVTDEDVTRFIQKFFHMKPNYTNTLRKQFKENLILI